jgi:hypothetical protein
VELCNQFSLVSFVSEQTRFCAAAEIVHLILSLHSLLYLCFLCSLLYSLLYSLSTSLYSTLPLLLSTLYSLLSYSLLSTLLLPLLYSLTLYSLLSTLPHLFYFTLSLSTPLTLSLSYLPGALLIAYKSTVYRGHLSIQEL